MAKAQGLPVASGRGVIPHRGGSRFDRRGGPVRMSLGGAGCVSSPRLDSTGRRRGPVSARP